jgi:hypothetical protein
MLVVHHGRPELEMTSSMRVLPPSTRRDMIFRNSFAAGVIPGFLMIAQLASKLVAEHAIAPEHRIFIS